MAEASVGNLQASLSVDIKDFVNNLNKAQSSFQQTANTISGGSNNIQAFDKSVSLLNGSLTKLGAGIGAAGIALGMFLKSSFDVANQVEEMDLAIGAVGKSSGVGAEKIRKASQDIRSMGIEMHASQEMAMLFVKSNLAVADASKVARVAQDLAVLSQSNSTDTATTLTYAIQTGNSELLKSAGITKYSSEAYSKYAQTLKKGVDDLSATERQQAVLNMVLEEGEKVAGVYEAAMNNAGKVMRSFPRIINDIHLEFGLLLTDSFGPLIINAYKTAKSFSLMIREGGALRPLMIAFGNAIKIVLEPLTGVSEKVMEFVKGLEKLKINTSGVTDAIVKFLPLVSSLGVGLGLLAGRNILSAIPMFESLAGVIGTGGPLIGAIVTLVALSPELRTAFLGIVESLKPMLPAFLAIGAQMFLVGQQIVGVITEVVKSLESPIVAIIQGIATSFIALAAVTLPIVSALVSLVGWIAKSKAIMMVLLPVITAIVIQHKLFGTTADGAKKSGQALFDSVKSGIAKYKYLKAEIAAANATLKGTGVTSTVTASLTVASFTAMKAAVLSFMASLGPMILITAAIMAVMAAISAFGAKQKVTDQYTKDLTTSLKENTTAILENKEALEKGVDAHQILLDTLLGTGEEADKLKVAFGALGTAANLDDIVLAKDNFVDFATELLKAKGLSAEVAAELANLVNNTDANEYTGTYAAEAAALEAIQDNAENTDYSKLIDNQVKAMIGAGELTQAQYDAAEGAARATIGYTTLGEAEKSALLYTKVLAEATGTAQVKLEGVAFAADGVVDMLAILYGKSKEQTEITMGLADTYSKLNDEMDGNISVMALARAIQGDIAVTAWEWNDAISNVGKTAQGLYDQVSALKGKTGEQEQSIKLLNDAVTEFYITGKKLGKTEEQIGIEAMVLVDAWKQAAVAGGMTEEAAQALIDTLKILDGIDPTLSISADEAKLLRILEAYKALAGVLFTFGELTDQRKNHINATIQYAQDAINKMNTGTKFTPKPTTPTAGSSGAIGDKVLTKEEKRIQALKDTLQGLKDGMREYRYALADSLKIPLSGDLGSQGTALQQTRGVLRQLKEYQHNMKRLKARGVPGDVIAEVVNAGMWGGNDLAKDILGMSQTNFEEFLETRKEIDKIANKMGKDVASSVYQVAIDEAQVALDIEVGLNLIDWVAFGELMAQGIANLKPGEIAVGFQDGYLPNGGAIINGIYLPPGLDFSGFLANGGITTRASLGVIGEAGPEAIIPLDRMSEFGFGGGGGSSNTNITINMPAGANGEDVVRALKRYQQKMGTLPFQVKTGRTY